MPNEYINAIFAFPDVLIFDIIQLNLTIFHIKVLYSKSSNKQEPYPDFY